MATGLLAALLAGAGGFVLVDAVLSTVVVDGFWPALLAAAVAGAVNALAWPAVIRFVLPFTVLTLGLGVLALNGLVLLLAAEVLPGVEVDGLLAGVVLALVLTALTTIVSAVLAIDDEDRVSRHVVRRAARRSARRRAQRRARRAVPGDRRPRPRRAAPRAARRQRAGAGALGARRHAPARDAGRPTGRRRPAPARPGCCTAATTTCRRSAGGRRSMAARS